MSIIINEFEIVTEKPPEKTPPGIERTDPPMSPTPNLTPQQLRKVMRRQAERTVRLRAH